MSDYQLQSTELIKLNLHTSILNNLFVRYGFSRCRFSSNLDNILFNILDNIFIIQLFIYKKEFPKLSKKIHLIKCFYHDFNHEPMSEVIETFYSKLFSGIEV